MAKVRVSFSVAPKTYCEELYIVGSTSSLGYWDVKKATKLTYCQECQKKNYTNGRNCCPHNCNEISTCNYCERDWNNE